MVFQVVIEFAKRFTQRR